jgi:hypothetical protein
VIDDLVSEVPEFEPTVREHVETYDSLLPHVLFGDFTRFVVAAWQDGNLELVGRCMDFLERALAGGDPGLHDLVAASFVENVGVWEPGMAPFVETWPPALRMVAERQSDNR